MYIWAIGILAAGQSSTMTGTYAGQFVMEGFLQLKWSRLRRVLLTRSIAILPTILVAAFKDISHLTGMNDVLNALQALQLPFALIPVLTFCASERIMRDFKMGLAWKIFLSIAAVGAIGINIFFLAEFVTTQAPNIWYVYFALAIVISVYFCLVLYLIVYCIDSMGFNFLDGLQSIKFFAKVLPVNHELNVDAPWIADDDDGKTPNEKSETTGTEPALVRY